MFTLEENQGRFDHDELFPPLRTYNDVGTYRHRNVISRHERLGLVGGQGVLDFERQPKTNAKGHLLADGINDVQWKIVVSAKVSA